MQGEAQKNDIGTRKSTGSHIVLLLGIVSGVVLTLLCEGIWLAYFVWYHHMFILGVNRQGAALVAVLIGLIAIGAALLINATRRIGV
jgi:heme/copper-type cytochrome/quinol oxidase subunit 1